MDRQRTRVRWSHPGWHRGVWARALLTVVLLVASSPGAGDPRSAVAAGAVGQWHTITFDPKDRVGGTIGAVGSTALIAGGDIGQGTGRVVTDQVDVYDGPTRLWSTVRLSQARAGMVSATVGDQVLFAGGYSPNFFEKSAAVDIYDSASGQWSSAALSEARDAITGVTVGSKALFAGGRRRGPFDLSRTVDIYDSTTGTWTTAALAAPRQGIQALVVESKVLLIGGLTPGVEYPDLVDIYDSVAGQWTTTRLPRPRKEPITAVVGSQVVIAGGFTGGTMQADVVDIYDSATGQWTTGSMARPFSAPILTPVGPYVLITTAAFPGLRTANDPPNPPTRVDVYDSRTGAWTQQTLEEESSGLPRVVTAGSQALFSVRGHLAIFDGATGRWSSTEIPGQRYSSDAASLGTTAVFLSHPSTDSLVGPIDGLPAGATRGMVADVYDATDGRWTSHALAQSRYNYAIARAGTHLLIAGGSNDQPQYRTKRIHTDVVDILDTSTGVWSTGALLVARETPRVTGLGNQVMFSHGLLGCTGCPQDAVDGIAEAYDSQPEE
jgi:hypothetical protein